MAKKNSEPSSIRVVGHLGMGSMWNGKIIREQYFVLDPKGICMSIPSTYQNHAFKIIERATKKK